nr:50S ribosomal protein L18, chloroplastic-like [Ipomoea batatas]
MVVEAMALVTVRSVRVSSLRFKSSQLLGTSMNCSHILPVQSRSLVMNPLVVQATSRANTRTENAKIRNRRLRKKYNGTPTKPRLSVFCSKTQLYAMLVDDQNKKCLFYGSTLQKSIRGDPPCSIMVSTLTILEIWLVNIDSWEAAERIGEELVKTCIDLNITEISSYDHNGLARGERMQAFDIPISQHGFLMR